MKHIENCITKVIPSQAKNPNKLGLLLNRAQRRTRGLSDLLSYLSSQRTDTARKIFNALYYFALRTGKIFMSQQYLADQADVVVRTVQRVLAALKCYGFVGVRTRYWNTCEYTVNDQLLSGKARRQLAPYLRCLTLLPFVLLGTFNHTIKSTNVVPISSPSILSFLSSYLTGERESFLTQLCKDFNYRSKRDVVMDIISPEIKKVGIELGFTPYAMLQLTAFDDETIQLSYRYYKQQNKIDHPFKFFMLVCRKVADVMNKKPDFNYADRLVSAAGYKDGDRLLMQGDEEAQPRYQAPPAQEKLPPQLNEKAQRWLRGISGNEKIYEKFKGVHRE